MSRSTRKSRITGIAVCASEKADKAIWHRAFRKAANSDIERSQFIDYRQFSNPWRMGKDGKHYWSAMPDFLVRK